MRLSRLALATLVAASVACSAKTADTGTASPSPTPAPGTSQAARKNSDVISKAELDALTGASTVYDAVNRLRPQFFREVRGAGTLTVRMDNTAFGGSAELRNIMITDVEEIRYLSPSEATARFGTGNAGPIIVITSKKAGAKR